MSSECQDGIGWKAIDGPLLWLSNGQPFLHEITVDIPWPDGTTSWLVIDGVAGHFADGVLSADHATFAYRVDPPATDDTGGAADRARYQFWVLVPDDPDPIPLKWQVGEVRRKDD